MVVVFALLSGALWALTTPDLRGLANQRYGGSAVQTVGEWEQLIARARSMPVQAKLKAANDFFNSKVTWTPDTRAWGVEDYWATPLETMGKTIGDCEDFSIAKYATLLLMGVPPQSLRMVYVKATRGGLTQAHMVLAWYQSPGSAPLILDNMERAVLPASQRGDLKPVFSFNGESIWVGGKKQGGKADPLARLSRWREVLTKMRQEGFRLNA